MLDEFDDFGERESFLARSARKDVEGRCFGFSRIGICCNDKNERTKELVKKVEHFFDILTVEHGGGSSKSKQ